MRSQLHTHVLLKCTIMAMSHGYGLILIWLEHMERYRVGFGRTELMYVRPSISAFLNSKVL